MTATAGPGATPDAFAPASLGPVRLRNRIIKSATFEGVTPDCLVTDALIDFHRAVAAGGVGMTTVAYCAVSLDGTTDGHQIHMRAEAAPGLRRLTDAVHAEGSAISAQIGHSGPVADARGTGLPAIAPMRSFNPVSRKITRAATEADIARVIAAHGEAAAIAADSGFDAVELHFGHNYFVSSFLSPRLNKREDGWGGSLANRSRVARQVAETVRNRVGNRIAVTAKLSMDDGVGGGLRPKESLEVAAMLEADGTLDALELTAGSSLLNPMYLFRGDAPIKEFAATFPPITRLGIRAFGKRFIRSYPFEEAFLLETAKLFRERLTMPLILLGGITKRETIEAALADGFDFVAMGRALLREPDLINRMQADAATPSLCIHCNRCMPSIYSRTRCVVIDP